MRHKKQKKKKKRFQRQLKTRNEDKKMGTEHAKHGKEVQEIFRCTQHTYIHTFSNLPPEASNASTTRENRILFS